MDTSLNFLTLGNIGSRKEDCMQYDCAGQQSIILEGLADSPNYKGDKVIIIGVNTGRNVCPLAEVDITLDGQSIPHIIAIFNTLISES